MACRHTVVGYMDDPRYQKCLEAGEYLNKVHRDEYAVTTQKILGFEFEKMRERLVEEKKITDPEMRVIVINESNGTAESAADFLDRVVVDTEFKLFQLPDDDDNSYASLARRNHALYMKETGSMFAWMVVKIGDMVAGRVVFQLYTDLVPRTCQNFLHLCRGDLPDATDMDGAPIRLSYKGSSFFRGVHNGWVQGGDISGKGGNGGHSAFGRYFPDESFAVKHDELGILGMANDGEHTNASSFYVTLQKSSWMDSRYVAFGRVVEGLSVVQAVAAVPTKHNQSPVTPITISDCGEVVGAH